MTICKDIFLTSAGGLIYRFPGTDFNIFRCECTNIEERRICEDQSETKLWDKSSCSCRCLEVQSECQTGMVFSFVSCRLVTPYYTVQ